MHDSDISENNKRANAAKLRKLIEGYEQSFPSQLTDRFPNILEKFVSLWEKPVEAGEYFEQLLVTQREGRQGFPPDVHKEIFSLRELYYKLHPSMERKTDDFWSWV